MTIRVMCGDGHEVSIPGMFRGKLALFKDPALANARSYELTCKASSRSLTNFLDRVYDESAKVEITEDNFDDLRHLAQELGFSGLDSELREFEAVSAGSTIKCKLVTLEERVNECDLGIEDIESEVVALRQRVEELEFLEERVAILEDLLRKQQQGDTGLRDQLEQHNKILVDVQRRLDESSSGPPDAVLQQVHSLEGKVDEMSRSFEKRLSTSLSEIAKRSEIARSQPGVPMPQQPGAPMPQQPAPMSQQRPAQPAPQRQLCTFATHGVDYITQKWYHCETCGLVGQHGCCEICAQTCHNGHKCVLQGVHSGCFCDCGAGEGRAPCQCMGPLTGMRAIELKDGIIAALTRTFGGNLHDLGQVIVTARDVYSADNQPRYVLDLDNKRTYYASQAAPGPSFCLDFRARLVTVMKYWVRGYGKGEGFLRSWVLEGSMNANAWAQMDAVQDCRDMKERYARTSRKVTGARGPFRFIRFRMSGPNYQGMWQLNCAGLELRGTLFER